VLLSDSFCWNELGTPFPKNFEKTIQSIFSRLFRIYSIIYTNFMGQIDSVGAAPHLHTSFKHFMLFVWEFDLVKEQEFEAIAPLIQEIKAKYKPGA
jgi:MOB kinase activator 1